MQRESKPQIVDCLNTKEGTARRVAIGYALAGFFWILVTDWAIHWLDFHNTDGGLWVESAKGLLFVTLSALLIYWLVQINLSSITSINTLLRAIIDGTTDAVFVKDCSGKYLLANSATARFIGKPIVEIIGADDMTLLDREDAASIAERDRKIMASGAPESYEEVLTLAGAKRIFLATKYPFIDSSGNILGIIGLSRDITLRKIEENRIRSQHAITQNILDASSDFIFMKNLEGQYLAVNKATAAAVNRTPEEVIGKRDFDLLPQESAERMRQGDLSVIESGMPMRFEDTVEADGKTTYFSTAKNVCRDADGNIVGVVGIGRDITSRVESEKMLRLSEKRYRTLVENLLCPVFVNSSGKISFCNPAFVKLVGAPNEAAVLGRSPFDFFHPDYHATIRSRIAAVISTNRTIQGAELKILHSDGHTIPVHTVATPLDPGDPPSILVICNDLTERERASKHLHSILASVKDAIITIDKHGIIRSVNAATLRMFGYSQIELVGKNVNMLMPAPHQQAHDSYILSHLQTGDAKIIGSARSFEATRKDGSSFPIELRVSEFQADGEQHFTGVIRDETERKKLEEQFHHSQKMEAVGRLAGGVAHDFNNLLTVINGYCDILLRKVSSKDSTYGAIASIREAGERAASLTAQLLAFSRKTIIEPKILDLNSIIGQSEKLLRRLIGESIVVAISLEPRLQLIKADIGQIDQIIMNLAINARDAMPAGGQLAIETRNIISSEPRPSESGEIPSGEYVEISVSDTGCGMSEEVKAKIFEPFFTTKAEGQGTGLGLAVVFGIVKQSGGYISVESTVGVGSCFKILFPAHQTAQLEVETSGVTRSSSGTETVLLVEDEPNVRKITKITLETQGYSVVDASSGASALEAAAEHAQRIDLLLTDVVMPSMSGSQLAEQLRQKIPTLKVLYMSGYTNDEVVRHGIRNATDSFIQKPFTPLLLARKVREVLDI